jgi:hypothetical protein
MGWVGRGAVVAAGLLILVAALILGAADAQTPPHRFRITSTSIALDPEQPVTRIGELTYAGGVTLRAKGETRFGGLSGIDVGDDGRFAMHSDSGELFRGRIVLNRRRRLVGLADATAAHITDEQGRALGSKSEGDAEDITFLPNGGYALSFEQDHRIVAYAGAGPARRLAIPDAALSRRNESLEALTVWRDPATAEDRLVVGAEDGRAWICDMEGRDCSQFLDPARDTPEPDYKLTSLDALPDGRGMIATYRSFDILRGMRAIIAWVQPGAPRQVTPLASLAPPLNVDNFEGVAAVKNPDGSVRLYIVSDDNFSSIQRTLMLAFDWRPPPPG